MTTILQMADVAAFLLMLVRVMCRPTLNVISVDQKLMKQNKKWGTIKIYKLVALPVRIYVSEASALIKLAYV